MKDGMSYVIKRNPTKGKILLGGLGSFGLGEMWFTEEPHHKDTLGYDKAEIIGPEPFEDQARIDADLAIINLNLSIMNI